MHDASVYRLTTYSNDWEKNGKKKEIRVKIPDTAANNCHLVSITISIKVHEIDFFGARHMQGAVQYIRCAMHMCARHPVNIASVLHHAEWITHVSRSFSLVVSFSIQNWCLEIEAQMNVCL